MRKIVKENLFETEIHSFKTIEYNRHIQDFPGNVDFTMEFDVKNPNISDIPEDILQNEFEIGSFANQYGKKCFDEIVEKLNNIKNDEWDLDDWSFGGRSNGWYILLCSGDESSVGPESEGIIETIVSEYFSNYSEEMKRFYGLK